MSVPASAQQTVIFVRHAERADGGAGAPDAMTGAPADPTLSDAGAARAARLAAMLADAGVKGIYTSEFKRTQETAKPLASKLGVAIEVVPSKEAAALVAKIKAAHPRDTVLIIGHSNTIPDVIRAFGGPAIKIADDEYSGIYILTPSTGTLTLIRY
jgi:broad specificity phosphatase PhoE